MKSLFFGGHKSNRKSSTSLEGDVDHVISESHLPSSASVASVASSSIRGSQHDVEHEESVTLEGELYKQTDHTHLWVKAYFKLQGQSLLYYKKRWTGKYCTCPRVFELREAVVEVIGKRRHYCLFSLTFLNESNRHIILASEDHTMVTEWASALRAASLSHLEPPKPSLLTEQNVEAVAAAADTNGPSLPLPLPVPPVPAGVGVGVGGSSTVESLTQLVTPDPTKPVGELRIEVLEASRLLAPSVGRRCNPYAVVYFHLSTFKTQTIAGTVNPAWGQAFVIPVYDGSAKQDIRVEIYDAGNVDHSGADEFLGSFSIPLYKIPQGVIQDQWFALASKMAVHDGKPLGEVHVRINYSLSLMSHFLPPVSPVRADPEEFEIKIVKRNVMRLSRLFGHYKAYEAWSRALFRWENPWKSAVVFLLITVHHIFFFHRTIPLLLVAVLYMTLRQHPHFQASAASIVNLVKAIIGNHQPIVSSGPISGSDSERLSLQDDTLEVYENERRNAFAVGKFSSSFLRVRFGDRPHWSDVWGYPAAPPKAEVDGVLYEWSVDVNRGTDADGWAYAFSWNRTFFNRPRRLHSHVRRRRWLGVPVHSQVPQGTTVTALPAAAAPTTVDSEMNVMYNDPTSPVNPISVIPKTAAEEFRQDAQSLTRSADLMYIPTDQEAAEADEELRRDEQDGVAKVAKKKKGSSLLQKYKKFKRIGSSAQHQLDVICSTAEKCKNAFTWKDPNKTRIVFLVLIGAVVATYLLPLWFISWIRYCIGFISGFNKNVKERKTLSRYKLVVRSILKRILPESQLYRDLSKAPARLTDQQCERFARILQEEYDLTYDPKAPREHPTIDSLAEYLLCSLKPPTDIRRLYMRSLVKNFIAQLPSDVDLFQDTA